MPRAKYDEPPSELVRLGAALRDLREREGLKQIEIATAAGVSESQISDIERAQNNPGWLMVARIVREGLGLTIGDFADAYERAAKKEA